MKGTSYWRVSLLYEHLDLPRFSLFIVNREKDLVDGLDDRLGGCERIHLGPYSVDELVDVLDEQAEAGVVSRGTDRSEFERNVDTADGDARVAIATRRIAAHRADGKQRIGSLRVSSSGPFLKPAESYGGSTWIG